MSGGAKKFLVLIIAVNVALALAFNLLPSSKPPVVSNNTTATASTSAQTQPAKFSPLVASPLPSRPAPNFTPSAQDIGKQIGASIEAGNLSTNEEEALNQLRAWAESDPEEVLRWAKGQPDSMKGEAQSIACFEVAETDPAKAITLAQQYQITQGAMMDNLVQQWAGKDLTSATDWVNSQPPGDSRDSLVARVALIWSQSDPANAAQYVLKQTQPGPAQDEAVIMLVHQWSTTDLAAANAWVLQFPNNPLRDRALNEINGMASLQPSTPKP